MAAADAARSVIIQIETRAGAEDADAIAAVDGLDCLWIGHMDLSCSLGVPGRFDHPDFAAAVARVAGAAKKRGKAFGRLAGSPDEARRLAAEGYDTLGLCTDIGAIGRNSPRASRRCGRAGGMTWRVALSGGFLRRTGARPTRISTPARWRTTPAPF
jgi:2-dehydro-3-deoxyglucarate aldolase/4-hydroxy-2-oxoheptanedioate aldolase